MSSVHAAAARRTIGRVRANENHFVRAPSGVERRGSTAAPRVPSRAYDRASGVRGRARSQPTTDTRRRGSSSTACSRSGSAWIPAASGPSTRLPPQRLGRIGCRHDEFERPGVDADRNQYNVGDASRVRPVCGGASTVRPRPRRPRNASVPPPTRVFGAPRRGGVYTGSALVGSIGPDIVAFAARRRRLPGLVAGGADWCRFQRFALAPQLVVASVLQRHRAGTDQGRPATSASSGLSWL